MSRRHNKARKRSEQPAPLPARSVQNRDAKYAQIRELFGDQASAIAIAASMLRVLWDALDEQSFSSSEVRDAFDVISDDVDVKWLLSRLSKHRSKSNSAELEKK